MYILIIQENGRHLKNRHFRECFCIQRAFKEIGIESDIWGKGHENFNHIPNFNSYDVIIDLENYDTGWIPSLAEIKSFKIVWAIDGHVRGMEYYYNKFKKNKCDLIFQATRDLVDDKSVWIPNCFDHNLIYPMELGKRADVGFCGNILNRQEYLNILEKNFRFIRDIFVIGEDMVRAINSYRLHFNRNISFDVNYRNFETIGCKIPLATNKNEQYEDLGFVDGENCIIYSTAEEMVSKIRELIISKDLISLIADNGYELSKKHTYLARAKSIKKILEEKV